ncbi:MAG: hypothetical protein J6R41_04865 [Paludibacteraceae bacterium]|nr:hypothetical protein [Paludibacteraceae bacterium]
MAEVTLKKKITLRRKEEQAAFTFSGKLKVKLLWQSETDLDLCLFFKKKNGEIGGVFSNEYRGKKSDLGDLNKFPFMKHTGDEKEPSLGGESVEQINIARLDEIDTAYVCIVNYDAAVEGEDVTYADEGGRVELQSDSGDYLEVLADSKDEGHVYCVCSIKNNDGEYALKNESQVMDLSMAFEKIPGFELIVNC